MTDKQPSAAERMAASLERRTAPGREAPAARPKAPRVRPVRITIDMEPTLHKDLKLAALELEVPLAHIVRALVLRMGSDPQLRASIEREIRGQARP